MLRIVSLENQPCKIMPETNFHDYFFLNAFFFIPTESSLPSHRNRHYPRVKISPLSIKRHSSSRLSLHLQNAYYLEKKGVLDPSIRRSITYVFFSGKEKPGFKYFWKIRKDIFTEEFQKFVDTEGFFLMKIKSFYSQFFNYKFK